MDACGKVENEKLTATLLQIGIAALSGDGGIQESSSSANVY